VVDDLHSTPLTTKQKHTHTLTGRDSAEAFCLEHKPALANLAAGTEVEGI
jgi:hypothetical protein